MDAKLLAALVGAAGAVLGASIAAAAGFRRDSKRIRNEKEQKDVDRQDAARARTHALTQDSRRDYDLLQRFLVQVDDQMRQAAEILIHAATFKDSVGMETHQALEALRESLIGLCDDIEPRLAAERVTTVGVREALTEIRMEVLQASADLLVAAPVAEVPVQLGASGSFQARWRWIRDRSDQIRDALRREQGLDPADPDPS